MFLCKSFALFALALSASALTTPHIARDVHHHRSIAQRVPHAEPVLQPIVTPPRKRSNSKRCIASSALPSSSVVPSSSAAIPSSTDPVPSSTDPAPSSTDPVPSSTDPAPSSTDVVPSSTDAVPSSTYAAPTSAVVPVNVAPTPDIAFSSVIPSAFSAVQSSASVDVPTTVPTTTAPPATTAANPTTVAAGAAQTAGPDTANFPFATGELYSGDGTWYSTGLGACGITNTDSDYIVAVSHLLFDVYPGYGGADPNTNPLCNKQIIASWGGNSVTVTATDRCEGCAITSLDFSPSAFSVLANEGVGRLSDMTWEWV